MTLPLDMTGVDRFFDGGHHAVRHVDLRVAPGEVVGLLGPNGSGKTTLLRLALGLLEPHAGTVRVWGRDPRLDPVATRQRMGFVAEDQILPPWQRGRDLLQMLEALYPTWDRDLAQRIARRFELPLQQRVRQLSKGMARRLALVAAIAHRPQLLLLDEPASGLDPSARREFLQLTLELFGETDTAIVFSSHHIHDVERIATRLCVLDQGAVVLDDAADTIQEEHTLVVAPGDGAALRQLPGFVRLRQTNYGARAVVRGAVDDVRAAVALLGAPDLTVHGLPLEDLFVELVGSSAREALANGGAHGASA